MEPLVIVIAAALVAVVGWVVLMYNGLVRRRFATDAAWAQIEVQLKRRHVLVPNLVAAVKGYIDARQRTTC